MNPCQRHASRSGWVLWEVAAVMAVVAVMAGYGMHAWQERKQRAALAGDLAEVQSLAYRLDRKHCTRTAAMRMTLAAAGTDLGEDAVVRDSALWRIHLELPATGAPAANAVDQYYLHRSPALVVYRTLRTTTEGAWLLEQAGATAAFVTEAGETFDTVQVPLVRRTRDTGSRQEFRFLTRDGAHFDSRC